MLTRLYIILFLAFNATISFACLHTYQFKIFPVGLVKEKIVTVDFKIQRTEQFAANERYKLGIDSIDKRGAMWVLHAFISIYDNEQKLISTMPFDTSFVIGKHYLDTLQKTYSLGFNKILKKYQAIELFTPEYISFCNYQKKCDLVKITYDSIANKDYLTYKSKKYTINIVQDTSFFGFGNSPDYFLFEQNTSGLYISSVRMYRSKTTEIIVAHLETGHEISMGWITSDPKKVGKTENEETYLAKEKKPSFAFNAIENSTYEEPLLHHGFGFDVFTTK